MNDLRRKIIENFIKSYNTFDIEGMIKDLHEDVIFENITNEEVGLSTAGLPAFEQQAKSAAEYFKERKQKITSWDFQDNKVIVGIDYKGILAGDLPNGIKAGESLKLKGRSEFTFKGSKIIMIRDIS